MSYPNNECGECEVWLNLGECNVLPDIRTAIDKHCKNCKVFLNQKFVRHIPSQCCYPIEEDGKTVIIAGARLTPEIDGKIFWEYVDEYTPKIVVPSDPYANHK